jgi:hypothetical protein
MKPFPHNYAVTASAIVQSTVTLSTAGVRDLDSAPPREFGGPGEIEDGVPLCDLSRRSLTKLSLPECWGACTLTICQRFSEIYSSK